MLIVDTQQTGSDVAQMADVERAIAMAASLASYALEQGYTVGLFVWSGQCIHLPLNKGKRHRRELLSILAQLKENRDHSLSELMESAMPLVDVATTAAILTPRGRTSHPERSGRAVVILSSTDEQATRWFTFPKAVDFAHCPPVSAEPSQSPGSPIKPVVLPKAPEVAHV
jgi:uncharacterized protein (DUF58 family)